MVILMGFEPMSVAFRGPRNYRYTIKPFGYLSPTLLSPLLAPNVLISQPNHLISFIEFYPSKELPTHL
jgi:hypothetical protein